MERIIMFRIAANHASFGEDYISIAAEWFNDTLFDKNKNYHVYGFGDGFGVWW